MWITFKSLSSHVDSSALWIMWITKLIIWNYFDFLVDKSVDNSVDNFLTENLSTSYPQGYPQIFGCIVDKSKTQN